MIGRDEIERAAHLIREGGLVAFPTETVYGLGANALDAEAVERIFRVKGRPHNSPVIVHTGTIEMARTLVQHWPRQADILARQYWPGPLTLVLSKHPNIPAVVTAGLDTVALRVPSHPVALALIREAGLPIAAPSANRFSQLSPTSAEHVRKALGDSVDMILDGGPTTVGIESTVVSLTGDRPRLLRPGIISSAEIEKLIGDVTIEKTTSGAHASPGMHARHYSPRTKLVLVENGRLPAKGRGAYLWIHEEADTEVSIPMPSNPAGYAAVLYDTLHQLDEAEYEWVAVERPPDSSEWAGILDRLERAAAEGTGAEPLSR
jgi:L-threonylcarbamoyladenylate synthase